MLEVGSGYLRMGLRGVRGFGGRLVRVPLLGLKPRFLVVALTRHDGVIVTCSTRSSMSG